MRSSISVSLPTHNLEPGKRILSLDAFIQNMGMVKSIAESEAEQTLENPNRLPGMRFSLVGENMMKVVFMYGASRYRNRRTSRSIRASYNDNSWDGYNAFDSGNRITINSSGSVTLGTSGSGTMWGMDTATGSDSSYTTYRIGGTYTS